MILKSRTANLATVRQVSTWRRGAGRVSASQLHSARALKSRLRLKTRPAWPATSEECKPIGRQALMPDVESVASAVIRSWRRPPTASSLPKSMTRRPFLTSGPRPRFAASATFRERPLSSAPLTCRCGRERSPVATATILTAPPIPSCSNRRAPTKTVIHVTRKGEVLSCGSMCRLWRTAPTATIRTAPTTTGSLNLPIRGSAPRVIYTTAIRARRGDALLNFSLTGAAPTVTVRSTARTIRQGNALRDKEDRDETDKDVFHFGSKLCSRFLAGLPGGGTNRDRQCCHQRGGGGGWYAQGHERSPAEV